jgi:hypothetical protein
MLAPVVINEKYSGFVGGILSFNRISAVLDINTFNHYINYTLADRNGNVIMSNRSDQKTMQPFFMGKGSYKHIDNEILQWVPTLPAIASTIDLWGKLFLYNRIDHRAFGGMETDNGTAVAPFQKRLYNSYTGRFFALFAVLLVSWR